MRKFVRLLAVTLGGALGAILLVAPAFAGTISAPTGNPYTWPSTGGVPQYQDVSFAGFTAGSNVYIQMCDGTDAATTPGWDAAEHCDPATTPSAMTANGSGGGTFLATDTNHKFRPFKGVSPSSMFICQAPGESTPNPDGLPVFENCKVRVTSNPVATTPDQAFLTVSLSAGGTDVPEVPLAIVLPLSAVAIGGGFLVFRRRQLAQAAA